MANDLNLYQLAESVGFDCCGVAIVRKLTEHEDRLKQWLASDMHGGLAYMHNHFEKRLDPSLLFPNTKSVIICGVSYKREVISNTLQSRFASYAWGKDYHIWIKEKLNSLLGEIKKMYPDVNGRAFVDTAPILEKAWAVEAGLGWIGKNSLLIHPELGSFLLLGVLLVDRELPGVKTSKPLSKGCGSCRKCIEHCPAGAITGNRLIHAGKCISRLTIEKNSDPTQDLHGWIFGCDACQQVCPHNKFAPVKHHPEVAPLPEFMAMSEHEWIQLDEEQFKRTFAQSPISRCGLKRVKDCIRGIK